MLTASFAFTEGQAGHTLSSRNTSATAGGVGQDFQYLSAADASAFDVGQQFVASFNPSAWRTSTLTGSAGQTQGPGEYAQFLLALSPNDSTHNWGSGVAEWNIVNRGRDTGWARDRSLQPVTGGLLMVPETQVFGDAGGGEGKNVTYGFSTSLSGGTNSTGYSAKFYNDFLCEPNSEVGLTGRCFYATGDITGVASQIPYGPFGIDGAWLHGIDMTRATFGDAQAVRLLAGQSLFWDQAVDGTDGIGITAQPNRNGALNIVLPAQGMQTGTAMGGEVDEYKMSGTGNGLYTNFQQSGVSRMKVGVDGSGNFQFYAFSPKGAYVGNPFTVTGDGHVASNGATGVSCAAGSVSLSTLTVTNGIVTHC